MCLKLKKIEPQMQYLEIKNERKLRIECLMLLVFQIEQAEEIKQFLDEYAILGVLLTNFDPNPNFLKYYLNCVDKILKKAKDSEHFDEIKL